MLTNPYNLDLKGNSLELLDDKLKTARTLLARKPESGGMPFYFSFSFSKPNELYDTSIQIKDENGNVIDIWKTASTNGKKYLWHPDVIINFTPFELSLLIVHETCHIILEHYSLDRINGRNEKVWAIAADYVTNSIIEHDFRISGYKGMSVKNIYSDDNHPLWTGNIPKPRKFADFLNRLRQKPSDISYERRIFADYSLYGASVDQIYDKIMKNIKNEEESKDDSESISNMSGLVLDQHASSELEEGELLRDIELANEQSDNLAGSNPAYIRDIINKLQNPKLRFSDIVRNMINFKKKESGKVNDWSRFKRRGIAIKQYQPKKKTGFVRWLALLDTSGSMSLENINFAISQLKCLAEISEGYIVCCDAITHWDTLKNIKSNVDLERFETAGGGGTEFSSFFNEYKYYTKNIDILIILTDCEIYNVNKIANPGVDTVWVNTKGTRWIPPFGRVAPLR